MMFDEEFSNISNMMQTNSDVLHFHLKLNESKFQGSSEAFIHEVNSLRVETLFIELFTFKYPEVAAFF